MPARSQGAPGSTRQLGEQPSSEEDVRSSRSAGGEACKLGSGTESTYAASTHSSGTLADARLTPLLKASPPTPIGRVAGRFKVRLWRASGDQPYGIAFGNSVHGGVVIAEDVPHLGLRKGDEVVNLNGQSIVGVRQCGQILGNSRDLEMHLYHRELEVGEYPGIAPCNGCVAPQDLPVCCDPCFNPPEPRCRATAWPMRDVLLSSGPIPVDDSGTFGLHIARMSQKQPFGLVFAAAAPAFGSPASSVVSHTSASNEVHQIAHPPGEAEETVACGSGSGAIRSLDEQEEVPVQSPTDEPLAQEEVPGQSPADEPPAQETQESTEGADPAGTAMVIKEDLPHLGLMEGDELLLINGEPALSVDTCKEALKNAMTIALELRRPAGVPAQRPEEASLAGGASPTAPQEQEPLVEQGLGWPLELLAGLRERLCCMPQGSGFSEERTGADRSHDADLSISSTDNLPRVQSV